MSFVEVRVLLIRRIGIAALVAAAIVVALFAAPPQPTYATDAIAANENSPLGANLNFMAAWSSEYTFVDAFKQSSPWFAAGPPTWQSVSDEELDLDANGWPRSLRNRHDGSVVYNFIGTVMFDQLDGHYPIGQYTVLYEGEGTLEYTRDAVRVSYDYSGQVKQEMIDVDPSRGGTGIMLKIVETDPHNTGNYIRNIRVIAPGFSAETTQTFHPDFLANVNKYKVLRYMDWMRTNWQYNGDKPVRDGEVEVLASPLDNVHPLHDVTVNPYVSQASDSDVRSAELRDWHERARATDARYSTDYGVPVEIMTELANEIDANPWVNMPHMASDDWVRGFAEYMRDNLESDRHIYVEYSNEVWNSGFYQARWVEDRGKETWPDSPVSDLEKRLSWFGMRSAQICNIWEDVFGAQANQVRCMVATQAANTWIGEKMLDCPLWDQAPCHAHNMDVVAIAPYFGQHTGMLQHRDNLQSWLNDPDGGLSKLFDEVRYGNQLPEEQWLTKVTVDQAKQNVSDYATVAEDRNIDLVAYEGGQHLVHVGYPQQASDKVLNDAISQLFMDANRDPRMRELYLDYYDHWLAAAGDVHVLYSTVGVYSQWGSWGSQEFMTDQGAPKRQAVEGFLSIADCPWESCTAPSTAAPTAVQVGSAAVTERAGERAVAAFTFMLIVFTCTVRARAYKQTIF